MKPAVEDILFGAAMLAWFALVALLFLCDHLHRVPTRGDLLKARATEAALGARVSSIFRDAR